MAAAESTVSSLFNSASVGGFLKWTAMTAAAFFVGGVVDFTFFHNHPAGQAIIRHFNDVMLNVYDGLSHMAGFSEYARNTAFLPPAPVAGAASTAQEAAGLCMDSTLGLMAPC